MAGIKEPHGECQIQIDQDVDPVQKFSKDFFYEGRIYESNCLELREAAVKGNEKHAKRLFGKVEYRSMLCSPITQRSQTILHVAAGAKQTRFKREMLTYVEPKDLELKDSNGNNAFCFAAMAGANPIAEMMLLKNPALLRIRGGAYMTPLYLAALFGQRDTASFLYEKYEGLEVDDVEDVFFVSVRYHLYDLALKLLNRDRNLAVVRYKGHGTALHMLAQNPSAFTSRGKNLIYHEMDLSTQALKLLKSLWRSILELKGEKVGTYMLENKKLFFEAAKLGNSNFLKELIKFYPDLVHELDEEGRTIFHIAVMHRHATIFNLMNDIGFDKQFIATLIDKKGNNLLHLAATYSHNPVSMVSGAALQMQQEIKTFKEVELHVLPSYREMKNNEGLTPQEVFTRNHKDLLTSGEKWMKDIASSCMATVIAFVLFAVVFVIPRDYNNEEKPTSKFIAADAVALSSSSISILMFLSILTSRYAEEEFLKLLPLKLIAGLLTLFISITTMMLSFSLSFYLAYNQGISKEIPIIITVLVFVPSILFLLLHCRLLKDTFLSSFCSRFSCN